MVPSGCTLREGLKRSQVIDDAIDKEISGGERAEPHIRDHCPVVKAYNPMMALLVE